MKGLLNLLYTKRLGSMSDPDNIPGLAHFCEHMAFLGTKKVVYITSNIYI